MKSILRAVLALLVLVSISAEAQQTFPYFRPSNGILVGQNNTYVTSAATSANVISLWSGTCNASSFLRGDGSCQSASASPGGANTQVQFNNSGAFGGDAGLTYNAATDTLTSAIFTANTGVIAPILNSPGALALSSTGANDISFSTNGSGRLSITSSGEWLVGGTVGTNTQFLRSGGSGTTPSWVTVNLSNFALLDAQNGFFLNANSTASQSFINSSTGTAASYSLDVANALNAVQMGISSTTYSGSKLTGAPTGQIAYVNTNAAVPLVLGVNNTAHLTIASGGTTVSSDVQMKSTKAFATGNLVNYAWLSDSTLPSIGFRETDATTNNGTWDIAVEAEQMAFRILNDGALSPATWLNVSRTGVTPQTVGITANNFTFNSNPVVTQNTTTANASASGCTSNPTAAMRFSIHGNIANVRISLADCTSNATTYSIPVGIPAAYRPTVANQVCAIPVTDNGTRSVGYMVVATGGDIQFFTNAGTFTASGTKGLGGIGNVTCTWNIN